MPRRSTAHPHHRNQRPLASPDVRRYVEAARRYWWILALILALEWGVGLVAAYVEYKTTFESEAIVWAQRPPPQLAATRLTSESTTRVAPMIAARTARVRPRPPAALAAGAADAAGVASHLAAAPAASAVLPSLWRERAKFARPCR